MTLDQTLDTSAARAARAAGGQAKLARLLGVPQSTVNSWFRRGQELPGKHVIPVERATGIPRHELRPDLYPIEDTPPSARHAAGQPPAPSEQGTANCPGPQGSGGPSSAPSDPAEGLAA